MSKYNGYELSAATTLQHLFVVNVGQLGPKLTLTGEAGSAKVQKMTLDGNFVELELKNKLGKTVVELVPITFFAQITPILK